MVCIVVPSRQRISVCRAETLMSCKSLWREGVGKRERDREDIGGNGKIYRGKEGDREMDEETIGEQDMERWRKR